jgi:hypothetical protein
MVTPLSGIIPTTLADPKATPIRTPEISILDILYGIYHPLL